MVLGFETHYRRSWCLFPLHALSPPPHLLIVQLLCRGESHHPGSFHYLPLHCRRNFLIPLPHQGNNPSYFQVNLGRALVWKGKKVSYPGVKQGWTRVGPGSYSNLNRRETGYFYCSRLHWGSLGNNPRSFRDRPKIVPYSKSWVWPLFII